MRPRAAHPRATLAIAAVAVAVAVAAIAHAETRPRYGDSVEAALLGAPVALDPIAAQSSSEVTVAGLIFDTLYTIGVDGVVEPHLALGLPEVDAARKLARIAIRRGVQLHDGTPLTANDVAESLDHMRQVRARTGWLLAPVAAVRASGDAIELELRAPAADLATLLALPQTAIARRGPGGRLIGSGPFAVERFEPAARELVLRAFDGHFAGRPYLDRLVLGWFDTPDGEARRFETGAAQLSARGVAAFAGAKPKYPAAAVESPASLLVFVGFGRRSPAVTGDRAFRQALDLALDRGALSTITTGERTLPTRLPLPVEAGVPPLDTAGRVGDPAKARAVLDAAGARLAALAPASRARLKLAIIIDATRPDDREIALRVSRGLDKLGIGFTIEALPADKLRDRVARGDCDLWIGQIAAPIAVATAWWGAAFAAGGDDWARAQLAVGPLDPAQATREFASRRPIVPLMFRSLLVWHRSDVRGVRFDASGRLGFADLYWFKGKP
jgi:MarR-like DNA-binding transcriptional regulator SgrR of sgrS sRNA